VIAKDSDRAALATLGRAVQRVNILRDIDDDAAQGRIFIATTTLKRFGRALPGERKELMRDQIAKAYAYLDRALSALRLPAPVQPAILVSAERYRGVLRRLEREECGAGLDRRG
jgi:phytoene synthase